MSYLASGFDPFFEKLPTRNERQLSTLDQNAVFSGFNASKLVDGSIVSTDERTNINLDDSLYTINDGLVDRVKLGRISENEYGLQIIDRDGNILVNITGDTNLLQSADGKMQLDLSDKQFRVYDQFNLRVLLGELGLV